MKIDKNVLLLDRARRVIPGVSQLLSKRPDQFSSQNWPSYFTRAQGTRVWDANGQAFLDMTTSGIGANVLGYSDKFVNRRVHRVIRDGNSSSLLTGLDVELAEKLCEIHPWAGGVRYARTGGEAMAISVRIARTYTGREKVLFSGYHGWHDWYMAANFKGPDALLGHHLTGLGTLGIPAGLAGTSEPFKFGDTAELRSKLEKSDIAAIVMEPVRRVVPSDTYLQEVRNLASRHGAVLIFDEISSGFRHTLGGAHLLYGTHPDIAVFAKAMSNGFPMAALIGDSEIMAAAQATFISSTYWSEGIGPAAALATIERFKAEAVHERLREVGQKVQSTWQGAIDQAGLSAQVSGLPALSYLDINGPLSGAIKSRFADLELAKGILASGRFYPNFAQTNRDVRLFQDSIEQSFATIRRELDNGSLRESGSRALAIDYIPKVRSSRHVA